MPWKWTLVINLLGRIVSFRFLQARLNKPWSGCQYQLVDILNDHYLVSFANDEDYNHVLQDGPWVIAEHYQMVQRWQPSFDPYENAVGKMAIWVRIPNMPVEYFKKRFLWKVGNFIGRTLKIDPTYLETKGEEFLEDTVK